MISSKENPLIKKFKNLEKSKDRRTLGLFVVEGLKEINMALHANFTCQEILTPQIHSLSENDFAKGQELNIHLVSDKIFETLTYRGFNAKAIAIFKVKQFELDNLKMSENPLIIVVESVEKPGNLGAILRTADACCADAVVVCEPLTDFYNPNVIRSSVGTVFSKQIVAESKEAVLEWLVQKNIKVFTTFIENSLDYTQADFTKPCAIIAGTEAHGLTSFWKRKECQNIVIPMLGKNDSLNVSVATAVIAFEAIRQRKA